MPRKRRQSRSPIGTPVKNGSLDSQSKKHTPRKDTPRRAKLLHRCSFSGCKAMLTTSATRDRHETTCRFNPEINSEVSMPQQFLVPDHHALGLPVSQCRFPLCRKPYGSAAARKKHEMEKHRFFEKKGRTVSPVSFSEEFPLTSSSRPVSCPPPERDVQQTKRRRTASSSQVHVHVENYFPSTSSLNSSLCSSVNELDANSSMDWSTCETEENQCAYCLFTFQNEKTFKQHQQCKFNPSTWICNEEDRDATQVLLRPKKWREIIQILSPLREVIQEKNYHFYRLKLHISKIVVF